MNKKLLLTLLVIVAVVCVDGKKSFKSRGSARGSSRKTNYNPQPAPTSFSYPQASAPKPAPKPTLFGWQEKPGKTAQRQPAQQPKSNSQSHSYPSSQTGLSGNNQPKQPAKAQENIQRSSATQNLNSQQSVPNNNQQGHAYPASTGLSGNAGSHQQPASGNSYPQGGSYPQSPSGLSGNAGSHQQPGSGHSYPQGGSYPQSPSGMSGAGAAPPPYPGYSKPVQGGNYGNTYQQHPQGPPPPYSGYGGYGGHSYNTGYGHQVPSGFSPQSPGYFGNYANNNRGFGGLSRGGSALTGVGIAGAGVGTLLTGLALWNLARSTGHHHHTVIYDNRGQPVAVAPANGTVDPAAESFLADLVNCTLTISSTNSTEVLAIPCAIATSFTPDADVKESENNKNPNDDTKCTVTVVNKSGREFMTTIPCSILLNTAAENNVTEAPITVNSTMDNVNGTVPIPEPQPIPIDPPVMSLVGTEDSSKIIPDNLNCTVQPGEIRDPINPCYALTHNVTVIPLSTSEKYENVTS